MVIDLQDIFSSTTLPPSNNRRIRIDGRLRSVGDTVFIRSLERNGTITDINDGGVWVLPHYIILEPRIEIFLPTELSNGEGISSLHRAWLNGLEIYFFDSLLCYDI